MCGRINVSDNEGVQALMRMLGMPLYSPFEPRWNLSPTAVLNAVVAKNVDNEKTLEHTHLRWGIKAPWATPAKSVRPLINARSETLLTKPTFRDLAKAHRAIVPVTGFYEWERLEERRVPYYVQAQELPAMLLASVYQPLTQDDIAKERLTQPKARPASPQMGFAFDEPSEPVQELQTLQESQPLQADDKAENPEPIFSGDFAVVTTAATGELAAIHHRTPVMLNIEQAKRWLYTQDPAELEAMMTPEAVMKVRLTAVGDAVNSSRNDGPECVKALKR